MKKRQQSMLLVIVLVFFVSVTGCMSTIEAVTSLITDSESAEAESENKDRAMSATLFGGLGALEQTMLFNVAYFQIFFMGGFDPSFDDFREGEGVTWEITGSGDEADTSFFAERALLRRLGDGVSWWYIAYESDEQVLEYEVLLDSENTPLEMVWEDADSGEILRHTFDYGEGSEDEVKTDDTEQSYYSDIDDEYRKGNERITVGAGTFNAEYVVYNISDAENAGSLEYHWWIDKSVPGDLVKYNYIRLEDGDESTLTGELVSIKKQYRTKFDVY